MEIKKNEKLISRNLFGLPAEKYYLIKYYLQP